MTDSSIVDHVTVDYRPTATGFIVDLCPASGEVLRLIMGRPGSQASRNGLTFHSGEVITVSGHRFWCVIETEAETGICLSIGFCEPESNGRNQIFFTHENDFMNWAMQFKQVDPGFVWWPHAYHYLRQPAVLDPAIRDEGGWSATWEELQERFRKNNRS